MLLPVIADGNLKEMLDSHRIEVKSLYYQHTTIVWIMLESKIWPLPLLVCPNSSLSRTSIGLGGEWVCALWSWRRWRRWIRTFESLSIRVRIFDAWWIWQKTRLKQYQAGHVAQHVVSGVSQTMCRKRSVLQNESEWGRPREALACWRPR